MNPFYFAENYVRLSYKFAKRVEERDRWANLLPFPQAQIVAFALRSADLWSQLVNYISVPNARRILCSRDSSSKPTLNGNPEVNKEEQIEEDDFFEEVDDFEMQEDLHFLEPTTIPEAKVWTLDECLISTSVKIRELVTERLVSFPNEFISLEETQSTVNNIGFGNSNRGHGVEYKNGLARFDLNEDDNEYDDPPSLAENLSQKFPQQFPEKLDLISELTKLDFEKMDKTLPLSIDLSDMYYDLSYDSNPVEEMERLQKIEVLMESKQRRLDILLGKEAEYQARQAKTHSAHQNSVRIVETNPSSPIFGGDGVSCQFLMNHIEEQKDNFTATKDEVRALMEEIQNEGLLCATGVSSKCGFYENLERIVQELIDLKEHSYPFLAPVQRKSVPDYHKKIANPMDLATVSKKIKTHKYSTKHDFSSDLFLIYSNCRAYNTSKGNEYIYHAKAMEERTKQLLQALPDNFSKLTPEIPDNSASNTPRKPTPLIAGSPSSPNHKDFGLDFGTVPHGAEDAQVSHQPAINRLQRDLASLKKSYETLCNGGASSSDPRIGAYHDITREYRAHNELLRYSVANHDFESVPSLFSRTNATLALPSSRKRISLEDIQPDGPKRLRSSEVLGMFPELAPAGALPLLHQPSIPLNSNPPLLSDFAGIKIPTGISTTQMLQNISELKKTRELSERIAATRDFLDNPYDLRQVLLNYLSTPLEAASSDILLGPGGLLEKPELNQAGAHEVMERVTTMLLQNAGFDSAEASALEVFTDIVERHMHSLGRTLQLYISNYSTIKPPEDMLMHTLFESMVQGPADLEDYVNDGIIKHGSRLREIRAKLHAKFQSLGTRPEEDSEMEDGALAGNFEEFTGDDFFGFKELGLDKELGLTSLSVPVRLLLGNTRRRPDAPVNGVVAVQPPDYPPPPPFSPLVDPAGLIGLLRPFFSMRASEEGIIDDELAPPKKTFRPRVPPVGKHAVLARRRQADQAAQATEKKHKRAQELEARRQQKLIKQKEKEQRLVERKAKQQERMLLRNAEKEKKRIQREEVTLRRKQEAELRMASKSTTTPDEERFSSSVQPSSVSPATSPISSTTTATSPPSSPTSSTSTSSDSEGLARNSYNRRTVLLPRREFERKSRPILGDKRIPQSNGMDSYSIPSSTSEGSFSGSASLSDDDDDLGQPPFRHTKPVRWLAPGPSINSKPAVQAALPNKPRKKPLRHTNGLASPASRSIKRKGPQK